MALALLGLLPTSALPEGPAPLQPMVEEAPRVELAPYMSNLQRLTHKLSLSVAAGNTELAAFYAYESIELLKEIQTDVPEYDGQPIAFLVGRYGLPPSERAARAARAAEQSGDLSELRKAHLDVISSCNACHHATRHGFIRIVDGSGMNPYNQDFAPVRPLETGE